VSKLRVVTLAGVYTSGNDSDTGDDVQRMIVKEGDEYEISSVPVKMLTSTFQCGNLPGRSKGDSN
jgi:hypothetical protein